MPVTLPTPWVAGEKLKPSRLNGFMTPLQAKFAAGIRSADIASDAAIKGTQLSSASGSRIVNANLENNCVAYRNLVSDTAAGRALAPVKRDNIVSGEVLADHLGVGAVTAPALGALAVTQAKLNLTTYSYPGAISIPVSGNLVRTSNLDTGLSTATTLPIMAYQTVTGGGGWAYSFFQSGATWWVQLVGNSISIAANQLKVVYIS